MTNPPPTEQAKPGQLPDGQWTPNTGMQEHEQHGFEDDVLTKIVLSSLPHQPEPGTTSPVPFFHILHRLKTTKREGWRRFGIKDGESIGDHMYRMAIITMLCPPALAASLDISKCTRMALIHDMAESLVGDITPVDGVAKSEKSRREEETMDYLCEGLLGKVNGGAGQAIKGVWREYEDNVTKEAMFVHDVDKLELLLQMVEYEQLHEGKLDLGEFSWVASRVVLPEMKQWADQIIDERKAFWQAHGKAAEAKLTSGLKQAQDEYYGQAK